MRLAPLSLLFFACGGSVLQLPTTTPQTLALGTEIWEVDSVTDLEVVRDVARSAGGVYLATNNGVFRFAGGSHERVTSADTSAVVVLGERVFAATGEGITDLDGAVEAHPPIGDVHDLHLDESGRVWAAGSLGVARRETSGEWSRFGDSVYARRIFAGAAGELWIATGRGLWRVVGDVIEEHGERSLPGSYVRSVVSIAEGRAFALVQDGNAATLSYYDSERWTHYTLPDFDEPAVGLGRVGGTMVLFTPRYALHIGDASVSTGVPLVALERGERDSALTYDGSGGVPARSEVEVSGEAPPLRLARVPDQHQPPPAPGWTVTVSATQTHAAYDAWQLGDDAYVADASRGVRALGDSAHGSELRTHSLLADRLRLVSDERRQTWVLSADHQLGRWNEDHFELVAGPEGFVVHALASDDSGLVIACMSAAQDVVTFFRRTNGEWAQTLERTLRFDAPGPEPEPESQEAQERAKPEHDAPPEPPEPADPVALVDRLAAVTHLAVRGDEIWIGIRVSSSEGERQRGAVVMRMSSEDVVYHHENAEGPGGLRMPDRFENIDLGDAGMAWFSTVVGAVRLGNSQAVTFGEARGVRGEVVSDVLVAPANKIWFAAAEGPGYYFRQNFEFRMPNEVIAHRPTSLTMSGGDMWGAGPSGLLRYRGGEWSVFDEAVLAAGPITEAAFVAVEGDAEGRIWALGQQALWVIREAVSAAD